MGIKIRNNTVVMVCDECGESAFTGELTQENITAAEKSLETHVCDKNTSQLQVIVRGSGLETTKAQYILDKFQDYFSIASEWEERAKTIKVTDASQTVEMQLARTGRLFLREKRIAIEKARKELKEQALREGKAIDGIANVLRSLIEPIEQYLDRQEHFVELKEKTEREERQREIERRMEEERVAREKAEQEERERIRKENERLRREAEERERILKAEREKAEAERRKQERERRLLEEQAQKEREAAERAARAAREKAEAEKRAIEEKARKEREAAEVKRREIERRLAAQVTCPHCGKTFIPENKS